MAKKKKSKLDKIAKLLGASKVIKLKKNLNWFQLLQLYHMTKWSR